MAEEIGQRDFAGLRRATGVLAPEDSSEFHFKSFTVTIGIKVRADTGELENVVKKYHFDDDAEWGQRDEPKRDGQKMAWKAGESCQSL